MADSARLDELRRHFEENPRRYFAPLASALRRSGDARAAAALARAQLAVYPGHLTGHVILGQALLDLGDEGGARSAFARAAAVDPGNVVALQQLLTLARAAQDAADARHWTERLVEADPELAAEVVAEPAGPEITESTVVEQAAVESDPGHAARVEPSHQEPGTAGVERTGAERGAIDHAPVDFEPLTLEALASPQAPADATLAADVDDGPRSEVVPISVAPLDAVVGLDVPPADPLPAPMRDALPDLLDLDDLGPPQPGPPVATPRVHDWSDEGWPDAGEADDALVPPPAAPFVTETMAALLAAQGHTAQAADVYERLLAQRPHDERLHAALAELRAGSEAGRSAPAADPEGAPVAGSTEPAILAPDRDPDEIAALMWRAAFAPDSLPAQAVPAEAVPTDPASMNAAPPTAMSGPTSATAGLPATDAWDSAWAAESTAVGEPLTETPTERVAAPIDDLSFERYFAEPADPTPVGAFEQWAAEADRGRPASAPPFAEAPADARSDETGAGAAPATPDAGRTPVEDPDEDLAQFNAWLRGLAE